MLGDCTSEITALGVPDFSSPQVFMQRDCGCRAFLFKFVGRERRQAKSLSAKRSIDRAYSITFNRSSSSVYRVADESYTRHCPSNSQSSRQSRPKHLPDQKQLPSVYSIFIFGWLSKLTAFGQVRARGVLPDQSPLPRIDPCFTMICMQRTSRCFPTFHRATPTETCWLNVEKRHER